MGDRPGWFPDWTGQVGAVIAAGASATAEDAAKLRGLARVIAVNCSHRLAPWADALYAADAAWWWQYPEGRLFAGLKITAEARAVKLNGTQLVGIKRAAPGGRAEHRFVLDEPGVVGHGGHSGFQAINLLLQFGVRRILLLGMDLGGENWHGRHAEPLKTTTPQKYAVLRQRLDAQAPLLASIGAEVVNCSAVSTLTAYPKMGVDEALERWREKAAA